MRARSVKGSVRGGYGNYQAGPNLITIVGVRLGFEEHQFSYSDQITGETPAPNWCWSSHRFLQRR